MHKEEEYMVVRAFLPRAKVVNVIDYHHPHRKYRMEKIHSDGFYEVKIKDRSEFSNISGDYRLL